MHLTGHWISVGLILLAAGEAYADLPEPGSRPASERVDADELSMSIKARQNLQKRLEHAVFTVRARYPKKHSLAAGGVSFDGACAAVSFESIRDILDEQTPVFPGVLPEKKKPGKTFTFFGRGLERVSSPFASGPEKSAGGVSADQYYLTTADWLTGAEQTDISIEGMDVRAEMVYRDESRNIVVLRTRSYAYVQPAEIFQSDEKAVIPSLVFLLLSPGTQYSSLTQHSLSVSEMHRYGVTNQRARNGYPIFASDGRLVGLTVGPTPDNTQAYVVHPGLLDRALHPEKYSRVKKETFDPVNYTGHVRGDGDAE